MFHALCIWLANKDSAEVNSLTVNPFPPNKQAGQLDKCNCSFLLLLCQDLPTPTPAHFLVPPGTLFFQLCCQENSLTMGAFLAAMGWGEIVHLCLACTPSWSLQSRPAMGSLPNASPFP